MIIKIGCKIAYCTQSNTERTLVVCVIVELKRVHGSQLLLAGRVGFVRRKHINIQTQTCRNTV